MHFLTVFCYFFVAEGEWKTIKGDGQIYFRKLVGLRYKGVQLETRTMKLVSAVLTLYYFLLCKPLCVTRTTLVSYREKVGQNMILLGVSS